MRCDLFCATDGDAGKSSSVVVASRAELGALRRRELEGAARVLGFASVRACGHTDGALGAVEFDALVGELVAFLREHQPGVVITFGPEGAPTQHRDHKAISRAATAAFFLSALATAYPDQLASGRRAHAAARLFYVSWAPPAPSAELQTLAVPATARIDVGEQLPRKSAAFDAHRTQHEHRRRFEELGMVSPEYYALAAGVPQPAAVIDDLYAGL